VDEYRSTLPSTSVANFSQSPKLRRIDYIMSKTTSSQSWLLEDPTTPFSLSNLLLGITSHPSLSPSPTPATRLGTHVVSLRPLLDGGALAKFPKLDSSHGEVFSAATLNAVAALGRPYHHDFRQYIQDLLCQEPPYRELLKNNPTLQSIAIAPALECLMHLPMQIGDYTDFYVRLNHAYNVGVLFRGAQNALQPNYTHLPVGYHGRASTVRIFGTPVRRPWGQYLPQLGAKEPAFAPSRKLDVEVEFAAFVCKPNIIGGAGRTDVGSESEARPIPVGEASEYIFGYVLMNDWSARDVQAWEHVLLGPFNSKNFCTTISPWIVLADALEPHRRSTIIILPGGAKHSTFPYLQEPEDGIGSHFDIRIQMTLQPAGSKPAVIAETNASHLLFSFPQMLAHHTVTGCAMNVGDLLASGTISGSTPEMGSLLEMTENGKKPIIVGSEQVERTFLEDGDEVVITGLAGSEDSFVGFGDCRGVILPAIEDPLGR
jgi:fumarylacetoacetase